MTESEKAIQNQVLLASSRLGARLLRNNVGQYQLPDGRVIRYGVANPGGSDLIGWYPHIVKPQDVGTQVALFLAVEVKSLTGRLTPEQRQFLDAVSLAGGIAGCVRSVEDLTALLRK